MSVIVFILIFLIQVMIDPVLMECHNGGGKLLIIMHHVFQVTLLWGSICFGFHEFHFYVTMIALIVHLLMKGCFITKIHNKMCGMPEKTQLYTLINHICPSETYVLYYAILFMVLSYDILHSS